MREVMVVSETVEVGCGSNKRGLRLYLWERRRGSPLVSVCYTKNVTILLLLYFLPVCTARPVQWWIISQCNTREATVQQVLPERGGART